MRTQVPILRAHGKQGTATQGTAMQRCSLSAFSGKVDREEPLEVLHQLDPVQRKFSGQLKYYHTHTLAHIHTLQLERCILLCMCMHMMVPAHDVCRIKGQRGNQSSPSSRWVPRTELRMSGLIASVLTHWDASKVLKVRFSNDTHTSFLLLLVRCSSEVKIQCPPRLQICVVAPEEFKRASQKRQLLTLRKEALKQNPEGTTLRGRKLPEKSLLKGVTFLPAIEEACSIAHTIPVSYESRLSAEREGW